MIVHIALKNGKVHKIEPQTRRQYNEKGWGIFRTVNHFRDRSLTIENVTKVNYWYVDIDNCDKAIVYPALLQMPLRATVVVETKSGFHAYWRALGATQDTYRSIQKGLATYLKSVGIDTDKAVCNINRFLRTPGYYHLKDPKNPFMVKTLWKDIDLRYTEEIMMKYYPFDEEAKMVANETGNADIFEVLGTTGTRIKCPVKQLRDGRSHSTEGIKGAFRVYPETNTAYCFACGRAYTSDYLKLILSQTGVAT